MAAAFRGPGWSLVAACTVRDVGPMCIDSLVFDCHPGPIMLPFCLCYNS